MFEGNIKGTEDFVWCIIEWKLMAACFVSCYWLSLPPSVVFFGKKGFYFSPSLSLSKEQIEMESLYTRLMDSLLLKKRFVCKDHTVLWNVLRSIRRGYFNIVTHSFFLKSKGLSCCSLTTMIQVINSSRKLLLKQQRGVHHFKGQFSVSQVDTCWIITVATSLYCLD